jgi:hypothetical protein
VGLDSFLKWFVDGVDVVYDLLRFPISGVFALDELELMSSSLECRVSSEFAVGHKGESNRLDEVRSIVCRKDLFLYSVTLFRGV